MCKLLKGKMRITKNEANRPLDKVLNPSAIQLNIKAYLAQYGQERGIMNGKWPGNHQKQRPHKRPLNCLICVSDISSTCMEKKEGHKCSRSKKYIHINPFLSALERTKKAPHRVTQGRSSLFLPWWDFPTDQEHHEAKAIL